MKNLIVFFLFIATTFQSSAIVRIVTNGNNSGLGSLRDAISSAGFEDTIVINFKGAIALTGPIIMNSKDKVTIIGPYPVHNAFSAEGSSVPELFTITNSTNIVFEGMGFKHFIAPTFDVRAASLDNSSVTFRDCLFEGCQPGLGKGGALSVENGSTLAVLSSSFYNNISPNNGGAIYFDSTALQANIQSNSFIENTAVDSGGAVFVRYVSLDTTFAPFVFINNTFYSNKAANTPGNNVGHAVYVDYAATTSFFDTKRWVYFRSNLLYLNGFSGQHQVVYPILTYANNLNSEVANNYYYAFDNANAGSLPARFTNNTAGSAVDYWGFANDAIPDILGLRSTFLTDGYGLKYFTIVDANSILIDAAYPPTGGRADMDSLDCRRAPRIMDGSLSGTARPDIGASEYTPFRISGSPGSNTWRNLVDNVNANGSNTITNYIEFDVTNTSLEIPVQNSTSSLNKTVYIDGFSQHGSAVPGPNHNSSTSDSLTPALNLVTFVPQGGMPHNNGIELNSSPNSIIAGLSFVDFNVYGILLETGSNDASIFGNVIGVRSNIENNLSSYSNESIGEAGILSKASGVTIGGYFHHQRNVIVDNGYAVSPHGANVHLINSSNNTVVVGNVIGLHPNGKDTIPLGGTGTSQPHGIYIEGGASIQIGANRFFGQNTIANHRGNGIIHKNAGLGNRINNNHIGTNYAGDEPLGNHNGVYIDVAAEYSIGKLAGNLISGNDSCGIKIQNGQNIQIVGNVIGGDKSVTANNFGNNVGVFINGTSGASTTPNNIGLDNYEDSTIRNVIINNGTGVFLTGAGVQETKISGNLIGVGSHTASSALGNGIGIRIDNGAHNNFIGFDYVSGSSPVNEINIISGNTETGILIEGVATTSNRVASNIIGGTIPVSAANPLQSVGNNVGIRLLNMASSNNNIIGNENDPVQKLVIVGNEIGVKVDTSTNVTVFNSVIGVDVDDNIIPNNFGVVFNVSDTSLVGGSAGKSNVISGNDSIGIYLHNSVGITVSGNYIGTEKTGNIARANEIGIRIREGSGHKIGDSEPNLISGNYYGLILEDGTEGNILTKNYFGLTKNGLAKVTGSYFGIVANQLLNTNYIGDASAGSTNYFATDSSDISIRNCRDQNIVNNVFGYGIDGTTILGVAQKGVGIRLVSSQHISIGSSVPFGRNSIANKIAGVLLNSSDSCQIQNTYFGTEPSGVSVLTTGNQRTGILNRGLGSTTGNLIGPYNVFGGNNIGIKLKESSSENKIFSNYFGTDTSNVSIFRNDTAIVFRGATDNEIGFSDSANYIRNYIVGIRLESNANGNAFKSNFIGASGAGVAGSNLSHGVAIDNSSTNVFGSSLLTEANTISNNNGAGISINTGSSGNSFLRNSIYENNSLGIDIGGNNSIDNNGIASIQDGMETPIIRSVFPCTSGGDVSVEIILNGLTPGDQYYVDLYNSNGYVDPLLYGEGKSSIYFVSHTAVYSSDTVVYDLTALGVPASVSDTLVVLLTSITNGSSSEFGKWNSIENAPQSASFIDTSEICLGGLRMGSIDLNNATNSSYSYNVLLDGNTMANVGSHLFRGDTLASGAHQVIIEYSNGCQDTTDRILTNGGDFEVSTTILANDTCQLNTGQVSLTMVNNSISGASFANAMYSITDGTNTFNQVTNLFDSLATDTYLSSLSFDVTLIGITDVCPNSNVLSTTIPSTNILQSQLNFGYADFCHDATGAVTTQPLHSYGTYSLSGPSVTFNTSNGEITGASANNVFDLKYAYGACESTVVQVTALNVPDPSFTFSDFCANASSALPVPVTSGGVFSLLSTPVSASETINGATGEIQTTATEFTSGQYQVGYYTGTAVCARNSSVMVDVFNKATPVTYATAGTVYGDTIEFCPNLLDSIMTNTNVLNNSTVWAEVGGGSTVNSIYRAELSNTDSLYQLNYYGVIDYGVSSNPSNLECKSDEDSVWVRIYELPVQPIIAFGDTAYCFGETPLSLQNTATNTATNWYLNSQSSLVLSNLITYSPQVINNNSVQTIYARDSSGTGCFSSYANSGVAFLEKPTRPIIDFLGNVYANNDSIEVCPNPSGDTLFTYHNGSVLSHQDSTYWGTVGNVISHTTNKFKLNAIPNTYQLFYLKDSLFSMGGSILDKACFSDTGFVKVKMRAQPTKPDIFNDSIAYCFGEITDTLFDSNMTATHNVIWYENTKLDLSFLSNPSDSHFVTPLYNDYSFYVFARDSTGTNCYSDFDSIKVTYHQLPDLPVLKLNIASNDTVFAKETVVLCPVAFDSVMANTNENHTIWQIIGQTADTSKYFSEPFPGGTSTLTYYADTLYDNTLKYCRSNIDSVYLNILNQPVQSFLIDTAYCQGETVDTLTLLGGTTIEWYENGVHSLTTDSLKFLPTGYLIHGYEVDSVFVKDVTGVTTLNVSCESSVDTMLIAYHAQPDTALITLQSSGILIGDTVFICPTTTDFLEANSVSSESYWTVSGTNTLNNVFGLNNFADNTNTTVSYFRDTTVSDLTVSKTCYSDTNSVVIHTFITPVQPLTSNIELAYCFGETVDSLTVLNGTNIVWKETDATATTSASPHKYLPTIPLVYNYEIDTITVRDVTGITTTGEECNTSEDTIRIAYHGIPDTALITLEPSGLQIGDTVFICPTITSFLEVSTATSESYWTVSGTNTLNNVFGLNNFADNTNTTVSYFRDTTVSDLTVSKTCYSDTNSVVIHTFITPVQPLTSNIELAYCFGETVDSLTVLNGTNIVWKETGATATTNASPHKYLPTIPLVYNYEIDTITVRDVTGITTTGEECNTSEDTIRIAYHGIPDTALITLEPSGLQIGDTVFICPTITSFLEVSTAASESYWTVSGTNTLNNVFGLNNFADNTNTTVSYFRDTTVSDLTVSKTCYSDTNSVVIHTFITPVQPLTSNIELAYCFGETVDSLTVLNGTNIVWKETGATATTSASPHKYLPTIPLVYNYEIDTITVRDVTGITTTGEECNTSEDTIRIAYHGIPDTALITLQSSGVQIGDTVFICPTTIDSLVANTATSESYWTVSGTNTFNNIFGLNDFADNSNNTVFYFRDTTVSDLTVSKTCYSYANSVVIHIFSTPESPEILIGTVSTNDTAFCEGDIVNGLSTNSGDFVNWFQPNVINSDSIETNQYSITAPIIYGGEVDTIIAYDSTGLSCFSVNDSLIITFNPRPAIPNLWTSTLSYCQNEAFDTLFSNAINDWYLNDSLSASPIISDTSKYIPAYIYGSDSTIQYYAQTSSDLGCKSYFSNVGVSYHPTPILPTGTVQPSGPLAYCPDISIDTLVSDSTLTWFLNSMPINEMDNDSLDLNTYPSLIAATLDTVRYFYTDILYGCNSDTLKIPIEIFNTPDAPVIPVTIDTTYCEGDLIFETLTTTNITSSNSISTRWYNETGTTVINGNNVYTYDLDPLLNVGDTVIYFTYIDNNSCQADYDSIIVYTYATPPTPVITTLDSVYCQGEIIFAFDENNSDNTNWYLFDGSNGVLQSSDNSTFTPNEAGLYYAQTIINDCPSIADSIEIIINTLPNSPIIESMKMDYCNDEIVDTIRIENGANGFWYESSDLVNAISVNNDFYWSSNTIIDSVEYFVSIYDTSTECFSLFDTIKLFQYIALGNISDELVEICEGYSKTIEAVNGVTYLWNTNDTTASINVSPTINTLYSVEIIDSNNCVKQDTIEVVLKLPSSCEETVYTAFSPNGDGVNETWTITGIEKYDNATVYIFNRWGDQIASISEYDNIENVWDGMNHKTNAAVVSGTYYYIIEENGNKVKDGWLQLVK